MFLDARSSTVFGAWILDIPSLISCHDGKSHKAVANGHL